MSRPASLAVADSRLGGLRLSLVNEAAAVLAVRCLDGAGVPHRILKGVAIAHLDLVDPSDRLFADADLLVPHAQLGAALTALTSTGFTRTEPPVRVGWERRFARAVVLTAPDGGELDLHVSLAGGYYGVRLDHHQLWARPSQTFVLAGTTMHALNPDDRLLHACLHSELGKYSGERSLRDVERLVLSGQADWSRTVDNVGGTGIGVVIAAAIHRAWTRFELAPHPASAWADALLIDPSGAADLAALRRFAPADDDGWIVEAKGTLKALRWPDRVAFVAGIVAPSRASLRRTAAPVPGIWSDWDERWRIDACDRSPRVARDQRARPGWSRTGGRRCHRSAPSRRDDRGCICQQ